MKMTTFIEDKMADFKVKVVRINDVVIHPNADRLELAQIDGWQCVIQKAAYKPGDMAVYIPIDSVLPSQIEEKLFGADAKIKLSKSRVRTIKIRGAISQGMLASCSDLGVPEVEGYDCTAMLGISKYEPPEPPANMRSGANSVSKKKKNPNFKEYGGLDNFKHHNTLFQNGEPVVITEKIHGTNFRCGLVPVEVNTLEKKVKKFFGLLDPYEFVYGSNKVQLQDKSPLSAPWYIKALMWVRRHVGGNVFKQYTGFYESRGVGNVYAEAVEKYDLRNKFAPGEVVYGEIYGDGIQKHYSYGCQPGEHKFVVFDLMRNGEYIDHAELILWCKEKGLDIVPVLYEGPYNEAVSKELTKGNSVMVPSQKVREGVVIRSEKETKCHIGRKVLKLISDEYLLKEDNTDFH
jgi:tRNA-binding EMAP/Myf-like protein